ncbi:unnamed protein product, partial [marine sediment metagenome]
LGKALRIAKRKLRPEDKGEIPKKIIKEVRALKTLGEKVRKLREDGRKWSLEKLEKESGVNKKQIWRIENDKLKTQPKETTIEKLAEGLGVEKNLLYTQAMKRDMKRRIKRETGEIPPKVMQEVMNLPTLAKRVRKLRNYRGLSLVNLAQKSGVSRDQIYNIEHDKVKWKTKDETITKLAKGLSVEKKVLEIKYVRKIPASVIKEVMELPTLGKRIRKIREYRKWSLEDLAKRAHISDKHINRIENNRLKRKPLSETIENLALGLGVGKRVLTYQNLKNIPPKILDKIMARKKLGNRIRGFREYFKLHESELGKKVKLSGAMISKIELEGRKNPDFVQIAKIANVFGVDVLRLLLGKEAEDYKTQYDRIIKMITILLDGTRQPLSTKQIWSILKRYVEGVTIGKEDVESIIYVNQYLFNHRKLKIYKKIKTMQDDLKEAEKHLILAGGYYRKHLYIWAEYEYKRAAYFAGKESKYLRNGGLEILEKAKKGIEKCDKAITESVRRAAFFDRDKMEITLLNLL